MKNSKSKDQTRAGLSFLLLLSGGFGPFLDKSAHTLNVIYQNIPERPNVRTLMYAKH